MTDISTIRTNSWDAIRTYLLSTTAPLPTPIKLGTTNIYSSYNSKLVTDTGYPLIIIHPPVVNFKKLSVGGAMRDCDISILIEVYHHSAELLKSLSDSITNKILKGTKNLSSGRLMNVSIEGGDYDTWEEGKKKIHRMSMSLLMRYVQ